MSGSREYYTPVTNLNPRNIEKLKFESYLYQLYEKIAKGDSDYDFENFTSIISKEREHLGSHELTNAIFHRLPIRYIKELIRYGSNVNYQDTHHSFACCDSSLWAVQPRGSHCCTTTLGVTPLMESIANSEPEIVKLLIDSGAKLDTVDEFGNNPSHYLKDRYLRRNKVGEISKIIKILTQSGINLNVKNIDGETPLAVLLYKNLSLHIGKNPLGIKATEEAIVSLLENGANIEKIPQDLKKRIGKREYEHYRSIEKTSAITKMIEKNMEFKLDNEITKTFKI